MTLTLWVVKIPQPVRREAFEDDMEEDHGPGGCQETKGDVVDGLVASSIGEAFVEEDLCSQYPRQYHCKMQYVYTIPALINHNDVIYSTDPGMIIYSVSITIYTLGGYSYLHHIDSPLFGGILHLRHAFKFSTISIAI